MNYTEELDELIGLLVSREGSDLHLAVGVVPTIRVHRQLYPLNSRAVIKAEDTENFLKEMTTENEIRVLNEDREVLFSYEHKHGSGSLNLRGTAFYEKGRISIALRLVPKNNSGIKELNLPEILEKVMSTPQGLFLIVGPAGHGKSTTMAAMIEYVNKNLARHIITIEDPVEFIFTDDKSIISQREIPSDAKTFLGALNNSLRADADVIMIGEMRDTNTMQAVITAAEVGHLVLSTVHANSASQTIHRIIDSFPPEQQGQVRQQLAQALVGIFSIRLIPRKSGGLVPAYELLLNNNAVSNLIRENRVKAIDSVIQTSLNEGMISLDRSLANLVRNDDISLQDAQLYSSDSSDLMRLL